MATSEPGEALSTNSDSANSKRAGAGRGAALKESMRQLLRKKAGEQQLRTDVPPSLATAGPTVVANINEEANGRDAIAGYPVPAVKSAQLPAAKDGGVALRDALRSAPATRGTERGEALKAAMRKSLAAKGSSKAVVAPSAVFDAVFDADAVGSSEGRAEKVEPSLPQRTETAELEEEDPWPELRLSPTVLGVEDGRFRAGELTRRGDFSGAYRMLCKVRFLARPCRCRQPLSADILAEIEADCALAKENVPPPTPPPEPAEPVVQPSETQVPWAHMDINADFFPEPVVPVVPSVPSRPPPTSQAEPAGKRTGSTTNAADRALVARWKNSGVAEEASGPSDDRISDPTDWNQQFFSKMEQDYEDLCAADGWDDIRRRQWELDTSNTKLGGTDAIPTDSDYFRVQLPLGATDRELRPSPAIDALRRQQEALDAPQKPLEAPRRQRRNLDALRRVEAETQVAMDKERERRAAEALRLAPHNITESAAEDGQVLQDLGYRAAPVLAMPDAGFLDSLDLGNDMEQPPELTDSEAATVRALEEFEKFGREKEERLAKWRGRFGD